ncbi:MAG TPA: FtsH protease activity modulator HflK [Gammaproteobacteria bacterium]|nr:FtsH protease activity modulator HflK [Gammaproteobacteria bacterium]
MNNSGKNPWQNQKSPPNLDDLIANFFKKHFKSSNNTNQVNQFMILLLLFVILAMWGVGGLFTVQPGEKAVVLRFGKLNNTYDSGIHWIPLGVDSKYIVNVKKINNEEVEAEMLTKDENYAIVRLSVFYQINQPANYLFNSTNPRHILSQTIQSALRHVVGHSGLDSILTKDRDLVKIQIEDKIRQILKIYNIGINVTDVKIVDARPPDTVKPAFDDVVKAREDEHKIINLAKAYENQVVPVAKGKANRLLNEAAAYREKVTLKAKADIAQYLALIPEFKKHPDITKFRIYMSGLDPILKQTHKIVVTGKQSLNVLSLSKLFDKRN